MNKLFVIFLIFTSFAFAEERKIYEDEINAMYSTEPIGHAYGYYLFEGNKVGRYIRNVGTFYREGNYRIDKQNSVIRITYTKVAVSRYPFRKAQRNYDEQKFETLTYHTIDKDGNYKIEGLELVKEKDASHVRSDIHDIRKSSVIKKSIK